MRSSTSPFRGRSYTGNTTPESLEVLVKSLQRENNSLVQEINLLRNKNKKVSELQSKIEMILKHNNQLLNENQRLARLINQKKTQLEHWRSKYDDLNVTKAIAADIEVKRLLNEIDKLKEDIVEMEHLKNKQMGQMKNQYHLEIQSVKRGNLSTAQQYELEIRKLKEYCEKKDYEATDAGSKLVRISKETEFQIGKLREQRQRLKTELILQANEHKRELENLRSKFDYNFHNEIETLKKQHLNQMETMDYENTKLKEVISAKNNEIQQAWLKYNKVKENYEDSLQAAHRQNDDIKHKMIEIEEISQIQLARLRDKMETIKQSDLNLLRVANNQQSDLFNSEIRKLKDILNDRNAQLQILAQQRNQIRIQLQAEILKVKTLLQQQIQENTRLLGIHTEEVRHLDQNYRQKNQQMKNIENYLKKEIEILQEDNSNLANSFENKHNQLLKERKQTDQSSRNFKKQLAFNKQSISTLKDQNQRLLNKSTLDLEDLRKTYQLNLKQLETKTQNQQNQIIQLNLLVKELKQNIGNKDSEIKLCEQKIDLLENYERQLRKQAGQAEGRWDSKQKEFNALLREQIRNMETSRQKQCEQLNQIHNNKTNTLKHQINSLQRQVEGKNKLINDLKAKYQDLVNKFEEVFSQRAAQKNLDIKIPGWLPDTIATKSLFDVFLKNKVLEYCS